MLFACSLRPLRQEYRYIRISRFRRPNHSVSSLSLRRRRQSTHLLRLEGAGGGVDGVEDVDVFLGGRAKLFEPACADKHPALERPDGLVVRAGGFVEPLAKFIEVVRQNPYPFLQLLAQFADDLGILGELFLPPAVRDLTQHGKPYTSMLNPYRLSPQAETV